MKEADVFGKNRLTCQLLQFIKSIKGKGVVVVVVMVVEREKVLPLGDIASRDPGNDVHIGRKDTF